MTHDRRNTGPHPDSILELLSDYIDDRLSTLEADPIEAHLMECGECRDLCEDVRILRQDLCELPMVAFPEATLQDLFARTVDANIGSNLLSHSGWSIKRFARAAVILLACSISWIGWKHHEASRQADLDRSVRQVRYVVGTTALALHRVEEAAVSDVLIRRIAEPLNRISSRWLEHLPQTIGRSGT